MAKLKKRRKWIVIAVIALLVVGFFGFRRWQAARSALPSGLASGNGRLEAKEVDVAAKLPLKVKEVLVDEGDLVKPGQVLVKMDTLTLESQLAEAQANVASAKQQLAVAKASIARSTSQNKLAQVEKARAGALVQARAGSQRELDVRSASVNTTRAGVAEETAKLSVAEQNVKVAEANVGTIQSRIDDATLTSPVVGRVLYRLAEPGEVVDAGAKVLTLVNLEDVYMEIFLPANRAAAIRIGSEARLKVDYLPDKIARGYVSFVSPEAQFTPKEVETRTEREKLMFRVKIQVPKEFVMQYIDRVKTGVRGVGYVMTRDDARWPAWLDRNIANPGPLRPEPEKPPPPTATTPQTQSSR
ncbi:MAG TPA: HlyD family efflux transporter periplasmic adaptor subunit [Kofleriaceae bacterium]|jgi:HlyD family secretion protein|nr:HlyD family efflux transporter periplasmic adaptor subunit [Kofleriaceae bacterium]